MPNSSTILTAKCFSCGAEVESEQRNINYACKYCGTLQFLAYQMERYPSYGNGLEKLAVGREDKLYNVAVRIVESTQVASTSLLQRHLRIGYCRVAALLSALVEDGFCGNRRNEYLR